MCGIAGYLSRSGETAPTISTLQKMIGALHHRGPDGTGFQVAAPIGLAHARLSIIDLATGDQPIFNEDRTVSVVFNGEIFNYIELRAELLQQGHRFATQSDTEVIVHLYEQYGEDFVARLNGQFAIALWDQPRRRLVLARDRVGIRPLYYHDDARALVFASEVKALVAGGFVTPRLSAQGLGQVCSLWSALPPETVFEGVRSLPPGHLLVAEGGVVRMRRYWDWSFEPEMLADAPGIDVAAEELRALLTDATRLQLRADVPVGAYLSGGLDSAITATIIRRLSDTSLTTYSLGFEDAEFDERQYQQLMSAGLQAEHVERICARGDIGRAFPLAVWHAETPLVRTAPTPLMLLAEQVRRQGQKVVLTGEGADEVFAGYDLFKEAKIRRFVAAQPGSERRRRLVERLYPYLKNNPGAGNAMAQQFFMQGNLDPRDGAWAHLTRVSTTQRIWRFFSPAMRATLAGYEPADTLRALLPSDAASWPGLGRDQYVEANSLMSGYLLSSQGDRMAMAHSIEGRYPFLDHRVIEFAGRLPPHYKLGGLREKRVLRRAFADLLPPAIANRVKQPYRSPDSDSFFRDGQPLPYVAELLGEARIRAAGYFEPAAVSLLLAKCRAGKVVGFGDNMALVAILSTMLLDDMFLRGRRPADYADAGIPAT